MTPDVPSRRAVRRSLLDGLRDIRRAWTLRATGAAVAFLAAAVVPLVVRSPVGLSDLAAVLYVALAAVGLNVAVGLAGIPSLGQGAFVGIGAFGAALLRARAGWDPVTAVMLATAIAAGAGVAVGLAAARLRGAFAAVATWLAAWVLFVALGAFPGLSGGARGIVVPEPRFATAVGPDLILSPLAHYEIALVLLSLALLGFVAIDRGPVGLALAALRQGPAAAETLGVRATRLRLGAFAASAALGGLAGALSVQLAGVADPADYGPVLSVTLLVAVLIGGSGTVLGPLVGAVLLALIPPVAGAVGTAAGVAPERFEPTIAAALLLVVLLVGRGRGLRPALPGRRRRGEPPAPPAPTAAHRPRGSSPPSADARNAVLEARDLRKRFGGVLALEDVSLTIAAGSIHALIGPNGSGKTTCLRILSGSMPPDAGTILLEGEDVTDASVRARLERGVARTLQRTAVFPGLTVAQHVLAGTGIRRRHGGAMRTLLSTPLARREDERMRMEAQRVLALTGLTEASNVPVERLPSGHRRLLMIATAYASRPRVLLLDEPAAGMAPEEVEHLAAVLLDLRDRGTSILLVEHDVRFVRSVADRVTVVDAGRVIAEGDVATAMAAPEVRRAYLGPEAS